MDVPQRFYLRRALARGIVFEVRRRDAHISPWCPDHGFDCNAGHAGICAICRPRQQVPEYLGYRESRKQEISESASSATAIAHIRGRAEVRLVSRPMRREQCDLVFPLTAWQSRKVDGDFLEAQDIKIAKRSRCLGDAGGIHPAIDAAAPLHVPGQEFHGVPIIDLPTHERTAAGIKPAVVRRR